MAFSTKEFAAFLLGLALQCFAVTSPAEEAAPPSPNLLPNSDSVATAPNPPVAVAAIAPAELAPSPIVAAHQKLYRFNVRARSEGRRLEVRSSHDQTIARCIGDCSLNLPNGDYKVIFFDAAGMEHEFEFAVDGPGALEIQDADDRTATIGLGVGIVGPALVLGGTVMMMLGLERSCIMGECERRDNSGGGLVLGGFATMIAGTIMTPIGWVTWARNRNPRLHVEPTDISVAVVPRHDGASFGLGGRF